METGIDEEKEGKGIEWKPMGKKRFFPQIHFVDEIPPKYTHLSKTAVWLNGIIYIVNRFPCWVRVGILLHELGDHYLDFFFSVNFKTGAWNWFDWKKQTIWWICNGWWNKPSWFHKLLWKKIKSCKK